jgi:hypothetical protein
MRMKTGELLSHRCQTSEEPPDPRIARYSARIGEHWVWKQRTPSNGGYPRLKIDGRYVYVHILWWEHVNGTVPIGDDGSKRTVDHMCGFGTRCVWPGCKGLLTPRGQHVGAMGARARLAQRYVSERVL